MTNEQREFVRALQDVQARYEVLLQKERERSDKYAATIAQRDQRLARLSDRIVRLTEQLASREAQLDMSARRSTKLAKDLAKAKAQVRDLKRGLLPQLTVEQVAAITADRFWAKVDKLDNGCWEWRGAWSHGSNEGRLSVAGQSRSAHRVAFAVTGRPRPPWLTRVCGTAACVNPDHWTSNGTFSNGAARSNLDAGSAGRSEGGNGNASSG